jgi:hypothetical protein
MDSPTTIGKLVEDNFVLPSEQIFAADFVVTVCAQTRTIFVHAPTVLWHAGIVVVTGEGSQRRYLV